MNQRWFSPNTNQRLSLSRIQYVAGIVVLSASLGAVGIAAAQTPASPAAAAEPQISAPAGYSIHQTVDLGGRIANPAGSGAMYDTLVNLQSGPRVQGETLELRPLPGKKNPFVDHISAFGSGFGGDPNNFTKLDASKAKLWDFSGTFRRNRQYFDYDLLGNPNIPAGQSIPLGPAAAPTGSYAWPQVTQSPVLFNTVRRMTDVNLTIFPLSRVTYRVSYAQNIFQGPSLSPATSSNYYDESIGAYNALLQEFQRNSTDDFTGAIDWKPVAGTTLTFEEQVTHFKADSYYTLAPSSFTVQEADGTPVAPGNWDSVTPYTLFGCNTGSMGSATTTLLSAPESAGGKPIINAACDAASSYLRSQPTRFLFPTESLRLQSSSIKSISMNGDVRFTQANMNMPNYDENFQGLDGSIRSITFKGAASARRQVIAADYGVVWQAAPRVSFAEQVDFSSTHQPGSANISQGVTAVIPPSAVAAGNATINYSGPLAAGASINVEGNPNGSPDPDYFGQMLLTNNLTGRWEVSPRATLSLTWRYADHVIAEGSPHSGPLDEDGNGTVTIHENAGIFTAALRPSANWSLNGTLDIRYADNAFTPVGARQTRHYRLHTMYRLKPWATISGAFNDQERHNNTNNETAGVAAGNEPYEGPIDHVDHSRVASLGAVLTPNERYGLDFNYAYSDVYTATNICFDNGASAKLPGTASTTSTGAPNVCLGVYTRGSTTQLADWHGRDFMDAPSQFGSVSFMFSPVSKIHSNLGYRISAVNGSQFFNDARAVNGSLNSSYQSPFVSLAWTIHPGLTWKAEYNYYGYGEGGPSGSPNCSTSTSTTSTVVPCTSLSEPTGLTESPSGLTAPRNFHANNVALGVHFEF